MSWIERDDLVRLIAHIVANPQLTGAVNGTAPAPVKNRNSAKLHTFHENAVAAVATR